MDLHKVFDSFSRRQRKSAREKSPNTFDVTAKLRNQVFLICRDLFSGTLGLQFWNEIHKLLQLRHGTFELVPGRRRLHASDEQGFVIDDAGTFLTDCADDEFLDFIEDIFKLDWIFQLGDVNQLVGQFNQLFRSEGVGYELTELVRKQVQENDSRGRPFTCVKIASRPQIIRRDNLVVHQETITPALTLLSDPRFEQANKEFLEALEDYKKGDCDDCLTKCCTAFESVMKVICVEKGWPIKETDTAGPLIQTVLSNSNLDGFFKEPLTLIATIRNRLSKSHGAGTKPRHAEPHVARYTINATASAILLLVEEAKL